VKYTDMGMTRYC